ncbi:hypothetical protein [Mycoplasma feriruminatoris]|uniref:hypothetical protein n=1 Tax=Mycoplasma feriruminatoris TaxID=1179777 RepID=UPI0002A4FDB3|nr:hypothetical protein [Mycoplasma feriruminatoris]UKS54180.1 hypothetical protein D500_00533 [Mycoplasma feriruminatoris]VZK65353.1 hypothetical protein MF5292_00527 [Mycoplasma feriruminatoris]VZR75496.1 hypothetical protein MF5294_00525 [Mycoplasma feriruminatoris]VZR97866.1 hypothetical protein MF5293_00523 [Mycoplasma feriruminatoris]
MTNYYDQTLKQIRQLIDDNNLDKALMIINQELEISYIPVDFEKELYKFLKEIKEKQNSNLNKTYSVLEIKKLLNSQNNLDQIIAIKNLVNINIRLIIDDIKNYLLNIDNVYENKALLLISLADQQIDFNLKVIKDKNTSYSINPISLNTNQIFNTYYQIEDDILQIIDQKDIFLNQTCKQVLFSYFIYKFPYVNDIKNNDTIIAVIKLSYQLNDLEFDLKSLNKTIEFNQSNVINIISEIKKSGVFKYEN